MFDFWSQRICQFLDHSLNLQDASGPQQEQRVLQTLLRASQRVQQNSLGPGWQMVGNDCWNNPTHSGMTQSPQDATRVSLSVQEGLVKVNPKNGRQDALYSFPQRYRSLVICGITEKLGNQGGTHSSKHQVESWQKCSKICKNSDGLRCTQQHGLQEAHWTKN